MVAISTQLVLPLASALLLLAAAISDFAWRIIPHRIPALVAGLGLISHLIIGDPLWALVGGASVLAICAALWRFKVIGGGDVKLLAAVALCVGTTIIIRMGKQKFAFVTLIPLSWLVTVTLTAGYIKIFSDDPKLGFLSHAALVAQKVAAGALPAGAKTPADAARMIFNDRLDAGVAAFFMVSVLVVLGASMMKWYGVLSGATPVGSTEVPYSPRQAKAA